MRVSEIYTSFQGEGPNVGRPTVFVRFAGCNLKCPGWPCDTPHAIDPAIFTKEQVKYTPEELAAEVVKQKIPNICLTGGEVMLQGREKIETFLRHLYKIHTAPVEIEMFTNGTFPLPRSIFTMVQTFILDWKLFGSGEDLGKGQGSVVIDNIRNLRGHQDAIKFTIKNRADYFEAKDRYHQFLETRSRPSGGALIYAGPVWGALDSAELASWILEDNLPWFLNTQLHKLIWPPDARRT